MRRLSFSWSVGFTILFPTDQGAYLQCLIFIYCNSRNFLVPSVSNSLSRARNTFKCIFNLEVGYMERTKYCEIHVLLLALCCSRKHVPIFSSVSSMGHLGRWPIWKRKLLLKNALAHNIVSIYTSSSVITDMRAHNNTGSHNLFSNPFVPFYF